MHEPRSQLTVGQPALAVHAISKQFGGLAALTGVSLSVGAGEVCGLIGPNGAGKTTLFDVISGFEPATGGVVLLNGKPVDRLSPELRARAGLRRTFQRTQLYGRLSIEDNVIAALEWRGGGGGLVADMLGLRARRGREAARRARARDVLADCELAGLADRPANSLTTGQARLVELARAIIDEPSVLLLDEPTSGLSEHEAECFAYHIDRLKDLGVAVVVVEHDVGFVMRHSDRVVVLHLGEVLAEGSPAEIQAHGDVRAAYLG
jgi:branched-chain amino acid transport system ATP-binding protein